MADIAVNPKTGERVVLVGDQWKPFDSSRYSLKGMDVVDSVAGEPVDIAENPKTKERVYFDEFTDEWKPTHSLIPIPKPKPQAPATALQEPAQAPFVGTQEDIRAGRLGLAGGNPEGITGEDYIRELGAGLDQVGKMLGHQLQERGPMPTVGAKESGRLLEIGLKSLGVDPGTSIRAGQLVEKGMNPWMALPEDIRGYVKDLYTQREQEARAGQTPQYKAEQAKEFITKDATGYHPGPGLTSPTKIGGMAVGSIPQMALGMGTGLKITQGLLKLGMKKELAGMIGGAIGEGGTAGVSAEQDIYDMIINARPDQVVKTPEFQEEYASLEGLQGDERFLEAQKRLAEKWSRIGALAVTGTTAALSTPSGRLIGKIMGGEEGRTVLGSAAKSAVLEPLQEGPQSGFERFAKNVAKQQAVDPNTKLSEGVGEEAVGGAIVAVPMGAAGGTGAKVMQVSRPDVQTQTSAPDPMTQLRDTVRSVLQSGEATPQELMQQRAALPDDDLVAQAIDAELAGVNEGPPLEAEIRAQRPAPDNRVMAGQIARQAEIDAMQDTEVPITQPQEVPNGMQGQEGQTEAPLDRRQQEIPPQQERRSGEERRRLGEETRAAFDKMTDEEKYQKIFYDEMTGLPNKTAFDYYHSMHPEHSVLRFDGDSIHKINDIFGYEGGNEVIKEIAKSADEAGVDIRGIMREKGDEFAASGPEDKLRAFGESLMSKLDNAKITVTTPDGKQYVFTQGIGVSYGIGKNLDEAETAQKAAKTRRSNEGKRPEEGDRETVIGLASKLPEGQQGQGGVPEVVKQNQNGRILLEQARMEEEAIYQRKPKPLPRSKRGDLAAMSAYENDRRAWVKEYRAAVKKSAALEATSGQKTPNAQSSKAEPETSAKAAKQFSIGDKVMFNGKVHEIDEINYDDGIASIFDVRTNRETVVKDLGQLKTVEQVGTVFAEKGGQRPIVAAERTRRRKTKKTRPEDLDEKGNLKDPYQYKVTLTDGRTMTVDTKSVRLKNMVEALKDESGSSQLLGEVAAKGADLIRTGTKTLREFAVKIRETFKEYWTRIRPHIRTLWDALKSEKGELNIGPKKPDYMSKLRKIAEGGKVEGPKKVAPQGKKGENGPAAQTKEEARGLIRQRRFGLNLAAYETNKFLNEIERETSKLDRETLPFVLEKTEIPKSLNRKDIEQNYQTKNLNPTARKIKRHFDKAWEKIKEHIPEMSDRQIEDYVTHIWDVPKAKKNEITNWFTTQNRFLKKRYIPTLSEGIEKFGLKPKVLDVAEIIRIHDSVTNKAIENARFVKKLNELTRDGTPLAMRSDKAPPEWVQFNHPALSKNLYVPGEEGAPGTLVKLPIKVHPDLEAPMRVIFDERGTAKVARAYDIVNGLLKKTNLSISLFHHLALGETGLATIGLRKTAGIYLNPKKIWKALAKNEFDVFKKEEIARDAISHGVQIGATKDIPVNKIQRALDGFARKTNNVPLIRRATRFMAGFNEVWDKALWSYLHDSLKLYGYESMVSKADPNKSLTKQKEEIAQLINDTFGGQNWDTLMVSDKNVQIMSRLLLSPDWTISTARQALAPLGIGSVHSETRGVRMKMGAMFWARALVYFGVGINLLNAAYRKKDEKEHPEDYKNMGFWDYTMFGNTVGHKTHLFAGRYKDGSERYIRWGKQFREIPELFYDDVGFSPISATLKKIGGKTAPLIQLTSQALTGVSPSGYRNDDIYGQKGWDRVSGIAKTIARSPLPFSSRYVLKDDREWHISDIALPSSKGMSNYKATELFKTAIRNNDERMLKEIYQEALRNKLPAFIVFNHAVTSLKVEATKDLNDGLDTVAKVEAEMEKPHSLEELKKLRRRYKRLRKEQRDLGRGMATLDAAIKIMKRYKDEK